MDTCIFIGFYFPFKTNYLKPWKSNFLTAIKYHGQITAASILWKSFTEKKLAKVYWAWKWFKPREKRSCHVKFPTNVSLKTKDCLSRNQWMLTFFDWRIPIPFPYNRIVRVWVGLQSCLVWLGRTWTFFYPLLLIIYFICFSIMFSELHYSELITAHPLLLANFFNNPPLANYFTSLSIDFR